MTIVIGYNCAMTIFNHIQTIKHWFAGQIELQRDHGFLWWPVWVAIGVSFYFALPMEPVFYAGFLMAGLAGLMFAAWRRGVILAIFLVALGFTAGQVRSALVYTPMLDRDIGTARVSGVIHGLEYQDHAGKQLRLVLKDVAIEGVEEAPRAGAADLAF